MYIEEKISKNKAILLQLEWFKPYINHLLNIKISLFEETNLMYINFDLLSLFGLFLIWNRKTDHAGFYFDINIFGLNFIFNIYGVRHWDDENNKWCIYETTN